MEVDDNNQQIERFTNMYEGFSTIPINECSKIKNDLLSELNIDENQLTFDCKLNP